MTATLKDQNTKDMQIDGLIPQDNNKNEDKATLDALCRDSIVKHASLLLNAFMPSLIKRIQDNLRVNDCLSNTTISLLLKYFSMSLQELALLGEAQFAKTNDVKEILDITSAEKVQHCLTVWHIFFKLLSNKLHETSVAEHDIISLFRVSLFISLNYNPEENVNLKQFVFKLTQVTLAAQSRSYQLTTNCFQQKLRSISVCLTSIISKLMQRGDVTRLVTSVQTCNTHILGITDNLLSGYQQQHEGLQKLIRADQQLKFLLDVFAKDTEILHLLNHALSILHPIIKTMDTLYNVTIENVFIFRKTFRDALHSLDFRLAELDLKPKAAKFELIYQIINSTPKSHTPERAVKANRMPKSFMPQYNARTSIKVHGPSKEQAELNAQLEASICNQFLAPAYQFTASDFKHNSIRS